MKRIVVLILVMLIGISFCGCGEETDAKEYKLGDSIETDIAKLTLENAQFAIKLNATSHGTYSEIQSGNTTLSDDYFTAEEYNPETDSKSAYVAAKGHTYIAIQFNIENLDRASLDMDRSFISAIYGKDTFNNLTINYGCNSENGYKWNKYDSLNILLLPSESIHYRCYVDIPVDVKNLTDEFDLLFSLPKSDGKTVLFKYHVSSADKVETEMSVDEAIYNFTKPEGQEYFTKHLSEYTALSGNEINTLVNKRKWNIILRESVGSWQGKFEFESDSRIKETIYDGSVGYFNNRTWKVDNNSLVIDDKSYTVCKISEKAYILTINNEPRGIINQ